MHAQQKKWRSGIITDKFIYNEAPFPQAHAATIAETSKGLIAAWFGGSYEGARDVCIWASRLVNNKWTVPVKVADGKINDRITYACYNPVLYYTDNNELLLFYKIGPNVQGWTGWIKRSKDDGLTWETAEALPGGFLGPIKNKPVMINHMLVCPSSTENNGWQVHFEYTSDDGKTWSKSDAINDGKTVSAIQPALLKYKNGHLQALCRSKNTTINESWSRDEGKTWSPVIATELPNNNSGIDAVTLKDGVQLLVYNHVKPASDANEGRGVRTPLDIAVSKDGKKWKAVLVLEDSNIGEYSYPSVIQSKDGMVHVVYTWRREKIKYVKIDPHKLKGKPIMNGRWPVD